jgi:NADH:ubiquinone oxidoreductase subunit E
MTNTQAEWQGKSESMFERMLQEVPEAVRDVFRGNLMAILKEKAKDESILEGHVVEVVNEKVPEPFKGNILKAFSLMGGVDMNKVGEIIERFPGGQESLIPILHALQDQFGYCPPEALVLVSQKKGVFLSMLYRLVTSYQAFRTEPPKKNMVTVCNGTGCHVKGGGIILKEMEKRASENGAQITLEKARCLGCCDFSPALIINGQLYSGSEAQAKISEILGK